MSHPLPLLPSDGSALSAPALTALLQLTDDAVFVVDENQKLLAFNTAAEDLLGYTADEAVGEHCRKSNRCASCMQGCGLMERGHLENIALTLYTKDGEQVDVLKSAQAFYDESGAFKGGVEVLRRRDGDTEQAPSPEQVCDVDEGFHGLVSSDKRMHQMFRTIENVAKTAASVLVRGESGTGKELVARALHEESDRRDKPFVAINCAAMSPTLMESELFGHVKGAFTGAVAAHQGIFAQADGGTLFLDEIAELPLSLQAKLLRVLETREVVPLGGTKPQKVNVRLVAATHRSLRQEAEAGRFREDLMFRLRVVPLFLPPLRERQGDAEKLFWHFVAENNREAAARGTRRIERVEPRAMAALLDYDWPGNVRELRNVVAYAFAVGQGSQLKLGELPPEFREPQSLSDGDVVLPSSMGGAAPFSSTVVSATPTAVAASAPRFRRSARQEREAKEREDMQAAIDQFDGRLSEAAEALGMSRATFWRKRKKYGL